jgi:hypothetical protein
MAKLNWRGVGVFALCSGLAYACGGSKFNASSGDGVAGSSGSTSGGTSSAGADATGGSSEAGSSSGGTPSAAGEAGAAQGGTSEGGTSSGGTSSGGTSSGGTSGGSTGKGGAGGVTGSAGAGGLRNSGDCTVDKDCPAGSCVAVYPGGFRTCTVSVAPATCSASDACCPGVKECAAGSTCVQTPLGPSCGLVTRPTIECAKSGCTTAADCTGSNAICVPGGTLDRKVNTCLTGGCRRDTDCTDLAGGKCEPVTTFCCSGPSGLYCVYPGKGCRTSADCTAGSSCQIMNNKTGECATGGEVCAG